MSHFAQVGGSAWDGEGWGSRAAAALGHHAGTLLIASVGGAVVLGLHPLPGPAGLVVPLALFGFVIVSWLMMRAHDRRLCEACMSAMPLDAARQATRYSRRFWMAHTGSQPRYLIPYLVVLIGSNFATVTTPGRIFWAAMQLSMIYLLLAQSTHRRLQPWCPWCRGGGGGEEVDATPPVLPHDDRQLV